MSISKLWQSLYNSHTQWFLKHCTELHWQWLESQIHWSTLKNIIIDFICNKRCRQNKGETKWSSLKVSVLCLQHWCYKIYITTQRWLVVLFSTRQHYQCCKSQVGILTSGYTVFLTKGSVKYNTKTLLLKHLERLVLLYSTCSWY